MYILESQFKKIPMWVTAHPPLYCLFNCIQYPDLSGQLLICKAAKSANKTGHKGHVSNSQAERPQAELSHCPFLHSCQNNPGTAQTLGSFKKAHLGYLSHTDISV